MKRLLLFLVTAAACLAADISGTWSFQVETDMGSGTPVFEFKQNGDRLSGTYSGQLGTANVVGTVKGDAVDFWFETSATGDKIRVKYSGKVEGGSKMKGEVDLGGQAKGTFTANKK